MKLYHHIISAFLLFFAGVLSLSASAENTPSYNKIVIFGDSLSDKGNLYKATMNKMPKSPPYYKGRFSNGLTWSDMAATYFADKNKVNTENYAVGGETVNLHNPFGGFLPYTFGNSLKS